MAKVCPEMKEALVADGRWREFVRYRDGLIAEGTNRVDAHNMAIAKVCPDWAEKASLGNGVSIKRNKGEAIRKAKDAADAVDELEARRAKRDAEKNERLGLGDLSKLPPEFWKRKCSTAEAFWWAFTKAQFGVGSIDEAPGDRALALYVLFSKSPDAMVDMSRQVLSKLIAKDDGEADDSGRFDGQAEYDVLAAMEEAAG